MRNFQKIRANIANSPSMMAAKWTISLQWIFLKTKLKNMELDFTWTWVWIISSHSLFVCLWKTPLLKYCLASLPLLVEWSIEEQILYRRCLYLKINVFKLFFLNFLCIWFSEQRILQEYCGNNSEESEQKKEDTAVYAPTFYSKWFLMFQTSKRLSHNARFQTRCPHNSKRTFRNFKHYFCT